MLNKTLTDFFLRDGEDTEGRKLKEIIKYSDEELEKCHNFIQWIFPTSTPSAYNKDAPLLTPATIEELKFDPVFENNFKLNIQRMSEFWMLPIKMRLDKGKVRYEFHPINERRWWMQIDNHNLLRMTRFMESCRLLGFEVTGISLYHRLLQTIKTHPEFYFLDPINCYWWYKSAYGVDI